MIKVANRINSNEAAVDLLAAGPKGASFLSVALNRGVNIKKVTSYEQFGDTDNSFALIRSTCLENSIEFTIETKPLINKSRFTFIVGWQYILEDCEVPAIVFHDSILPMYRGFAPTVTALICGDDRIGVSALRLASTVDSGPIVAQRWVDLKYPIKIRDALRLQVDLMVQIAIEIVHSSIDLEGTSQNEDDVTLSIWRSDDDYWIDWSDSAERISRFIDALGPPYAGACTLYGDKVIRIFDASTVHTPPFAIRQPGKFWSIADGHPVVVCGSGALRIDFAAFDGVQLYFNRLRTRFGSREGLR